MSSKETKLWEPELCEEIKSRFYHEDGVLYHKTISKSAGRKDGYYYRPGDKVATQLNGKGAMRIQFSYQGKQRKFLVHRIVWFLEYGTQVLLIDHKDVNPQNNRPDNLREGTDAKNQHNKSPLGGSSKYKGVTWVHDRQKWKSLITIDKKTYSLGRFDSEIEAARAYDEKARELFGEFALTNF